MKRVETINPAIAAYFQMLRQAQKGPKGRTLSQGLLAERVSRHIRRTVGQYEISRIESGAIPDGDVMIALLGLLGGHINDVTSLLKKDNPSDVDGKHLAAEAIAAMAKEIPTEAALDKLIADWQADEQLRRSLRRPWRGEHASDDVSQQ